MPRKGGRHVSGASGCTFIPSLSIKDGKRDRRIVTKFFYDKSEYDKEIGLLTKVRYADPTQRLTKNQLPTDISSDRIDYSKIFAEKSILSRGDEFEENGANCKDVPANPKDALGYFKKMYYIQYPYAGIDLNQLLSMKLTFETTKNIINGLGELLKDLKRINMRGFFHKDIHSGNITYLDSEKKCYLIDFGMFEQNSSMNTLTCFSDLGQFITAVSEFTESLYSNQSQKKTKDIPSTNLSVLRSFLLVTNQNIKDIINPIVRTKPPSSDIMICNDGYDKVIEQFNKFVTDYSKVYGGKTRKIAQANRKTLRRRKVRRNVH